MVHDNGLLVNLKVEKGEFTPFKTHPFVFKLVFALFGHPSFQYSAILQARITDDDSIPTVLICSILLIQ